MGIIEYGIRLDRWSCNLNIISRTSEEKLLIDNHLIYTRTDYRNYGRGLEQASGLSLLLLAATFSFGPDYIYQPEYLGVQTIIWAWLLLLLGAGQIAYHGVHQRQVFSVVSSALWITISINSYMEVGGWNLTTAISLPYALTSFYIYSYISTVRAADDRFN